MIVDVNEVKIMKHSEQLKTYQTQSDPPYYPHN